MSTIPRAAPEPGADAQAKNSRPSAEGVTGTRCPARPKPHTAGNKKQRRGGKNKEDKDELIHLFVPALEDDGEGSVPDQVLPAELKLSHRLHGAAPGGPRSRRGGCGREGFRAAKGRGGGGGWR